MVLWYVYTLAAASEGSKDRAREALERAVAAQKAGDLKGAVKSFDRALKLHPSLAEAHFSRALLAQSAGENAMALRGYKRAIELRPSLAEAHFNRGNVLRVMHGKDEEVEDAYRQAIAARQPAVYGKVRHHESRHSDSSKVGLICVACNRSGVAQPRGNAAEGGQREGCARGVQCRLPRPFGLRWAAFAAQAAR